MKEVHFFKVCREFKILLDRYKAAVKFNIHSDLGITFAIIFNHHLSSVLRTIIVFILSLLCKWDTFKFR